jgi:hypothetical protein
MRTLPPGSCADAFYHELAHAFSHFTWVQSEGELIVCDIQGVDNAWTDPQVRAVCFFLRSYK